jgi:26-hydroxylase
LQNEVECFLRTLSKSESEPTDLNEPLCMSISNVICSIIMNVRFKHEDSRFKRFMFLIEEGFRLFSTAAAINFVPFLRILPGMTTACKKLEKVNNFLLFAICDIIYQHFLRLNQILPTES